MDISKLIPFIKKAVELTVSPEEVAAQMQKAEQTKQEDRERETVDNEVIEQDEKESDDQKNDEGALLETGFKELDVEDAIEKAKEEKRLEDSPNLATNNKLGMMLFSKRQTYWDLLQLKIK